MLAYQKRQKSSKQFISVIADDLYTTESSQDESAMDTFCSHHNITTVDPKLVTELKRDLSIQEVMMAIGGMQRGKTPGPDCFPSEFLKMFSNELGPLLLSESYSFGTLLPVMREVVVLLILKKNKDPLQCSSYLPISLLNTDAKILANILSQRLEVALPTISSTDESGFIKGRYSFFNIGRFLSIILDSPSTDTPDLVT